MLITFGKHKGTSIPSVVLKEPDYVRWVLGQHNAEGALAKVEAEMKELVASFDAKPIARGCAGHICKANATCFSTYFGSPSSLHFWCDSCDPYQSGANKGKLSKCKTYQEALAHIEFSCKGTRTGYKAIIRELALAKGLTQRSGEAQIAAFFA